MLTTEEFRIWCQRLQLSKETEEIITAIRSSPPVRKVKGRAGNVSGKYPSPKMQVSIQFESHHVELWAIYAMERDDDVLEYYDQASRIPLSYRAKSGRKTTQWHTPDFFVLRQGSAGWEEWKPASSLDQLAVDMPGRYQSASTGQWKCPPGEAYAEALGLSYRVRSSAEYRPLYIQNLKFLQDFWAHQVPIEAEQGVLVQTLVDTYPGICLTEILDAHPTLSLDVVWALLATRRLFTDLNATSLMHHDQVALYRHEAEAALAPPVVVSRPQSPSPPLIWDGRLWLVESVGDLVTLRPEVGETLTLPSTQLQRLMQEGAIRIMTAADFSPTTPEIREALLHASPKAQKVANQRMEQILTYVQGGEITTPERTVQRWLAAYQKAEEQYGCGYIGLLDHVADRGNRTRRISDTSMQMLETYLKTHYAVPQAKRAAAVYRLYHEECLRQQIPPVSQRTFYRVRARFTTPEVTATRLGRRAAYAKQPFFWHLDQTTPRHGERPFALAHLDHTQLDILLVSSVTGKPLEKPWATLLTDAYSRRILACYVTYDPPSYRSAMMVFRQCVQRYQRLPQELVVDRGADFGSVYFETLLTRYFITKKERPPQQPHFGSVIERLFGTTTTVFLNQLLGNTQAAKIPRQMTSEVDPKHLAVWTLERFSAWFAEWAYEVYDQMEHPALFQSPRDAFTQGMQLAGPRAHRLLPYSEEFIMLTRPTTRTGRAKVNPSQGITVNWLHYWNPAFQNSDVAGSSVPVRYEPYDMGVVYAWVSGQWLECIADDYGQVHGRSEREWNLILDEWREHQRQHGKKRVTVNGRLVARFLEENILEERILLQRQRDLEEQSLREAVVGKQTVKGKEPERREDFELDLTTIPRYEEYH
jgi:putative transposase